MSDMIDLASVKILNSPDIHTWPATTAITRLELRTSGVHVEFTKQTGADRWPDFPFDDPAKGGTLQYTLWIVMQILGEWCAAGCIGFWFGLDENGGPVADYAKNWYYDPNRWPGMAGHQPAPGERVGFLLTSGDARHGNEWVGLHERSNIVAIAFPDDAGGVFTFDASQPAPTTALPPDQPPAPAPAPTPAPTPAPAPSDTAQDALIRLFENVERLVDGVEDMAHSAKSIIDRLDEFQRDGVRIRL